MTDSSASMLAPAPGTLTGPGTGANTDTHPSTTIRTALARAGRDDYHRWLEHVTSAAGCAHPVRLRGDLATVDTRTGEVLAVTPTGALPDGVIYKACGNRRHTVCPSCATVYQHDAFHLIRAGLTGGKTVPESVTRHPAVFATFTAPSFGPVHSRFVRSCTCRDKASCRCRAEPCHARRNAETCPHGVQLVCWRRHAPGDEQLGWPLCPDCYDHDHHVVWNHHTGELWRRTKQAAERHLNQLARRRGLPKVRLSHGKAAEYQARGAVHFHVLLRLDGLDPDDKSAIIPPPAGLDAHDLVEAVEHASIQAFATAPHPVRPDGWPIYWGDQLDVRPITLSGTGDQLSDQAVAAYLAKYSTKGTEATGHVSRRLDGESIDLYANPTGTHPERLIAAAWDLGQAPGFEGLRRWAHMLGFGGHFLTKARRYSITFTQIRTDRAEHRRHLARTETRAAALDRQDHLDTETEDTTLVVGFLTYAGTGWHSAGDQLLANTAAAQSREYARAGREELAFEQACSSSTPLAA
ncbi:replication initiator [Actinocorallia sp. B10E7]|uniref:replication initiator n=1 Tax=Actinocorallia sp. B10E7 TaxID=3153558 RepID=UPI00325D3B7E